MKKIIVLALRLLCSVALVVQTTPLSVAKGQQPTATAGTSFVLEDGTPVRLRLSQTVSSADARVNDRVEFEVLEDVKVGDKVVVPKGGVAWGTVTEARGKEGWLVVGNWKSSWIQFGLLTVKGCSPCG